jgi:hypothetical protein
MARKRGGGSRRRTRRGGGNLDAEVDAAVQLVLAWPQMADAVSAELGVPLGKDMATGIRVAAGLAAVATAKAD